MLTYAQLSTILAALRHWQDEVPPEERLTYPHFLDVEPLTNEQIDQLCERLGNATTCDSPVPTQQGRSK